MVLSIQVNYLILAALIVLAGCSAPGTPKMANSQADGEDIPNCQNVSVSNKVDQYITNSYLTTWGSALVEGAAEGYKQEESSLMASLVSLVSGSNKINDQAVSKNHRGVTSNKAPLTALPFCRKYTANFALVADAVSKALLQLDNKVILSNKQKGQFETDYMTRSRDQWNLTAEAKRKPKSLVTSPIWKDKYTILVSQQSPTVTELWVLRSVYINRSGEAFNQGFSVGHNEAWIMSRVAELLGM